MSIPEMVYRVYVSVNASEIVRSAVTPSPPVMLLT
jgi:hypothetical protein